MPRPKIRLASRDYPQITAMRSVGASKGTVAKRLRMSPSSFRKVLERDKRAAEAWEAGEAQLESDLVGSLYEQAMDAKNKNCTAAIFLLKTIRNFIDNPQPQSTENRVSIEFRLPGALTEDQYKKLVDITPKKALKGATDEK